MQLCATETNQYVMDFMIEGVNCIWCMNQNTDICLPPNQDNFAEIWKLSDIITKIGANFIFLIITDKFEWQNELLLGFLRPWHLKN